MARVYVEKARRVNADQFLTATTPWPPGVTDTGNGPVYTFASGATVPIHDGDWITVDVRNGQTEVLTNAAFNDRYGSGPQADMINAGG